MNGAERRRQRKKDGKAAKNAEPEQQTPTIPETLALAVQHQKAGDLATAEELYNQVLQADPHQPDALHLLGVMAHQVGNNDVAVDLISQALAIRPGYAEAHYNLGTALQDLSALDKAADSYNKAIAIKPDYPMAHNNLGNVLKNLGRLDAAVASYQDALKVQPEYAMAHNNLGTALKELGRLEEAVDSFHNALAIMPEYAEAHCNLGNAFTKQGRLEEAVASFHRALVLQPEFAEAHNNIGAVLLDQGRLDEAVISFQKALVLQPDFVYAHNNLGNALQDSGKLAEAVDSYHKALSLQPDYAEAHNNLGNVLQDLEKPEEAVDSYHKALSLKPDYVEAHSNLAIALQDQGDVDGAARQIDLALSHQPENAGLGIRKALLLPVIPSSEDDIRTRRENIDQALQTLGEQNLTLVDPMVEVGVSNFYLAYHNQNNRNIQEAIAGLYMAACPNLTYEAEHCRPDQRDQSEAKDVLSIGILSSFLWDHTIGLLMHGIIEHLSRDKFEVILFRPPGKKDRISEILDRAADRVVPLSGRLERDQQAIEEEKPDILLYPDIGMSHYTYCLAFARLAPVQAVTWGHPDTTGIPNIDYFLSSDLLEVSGASDHYSERLILLENVPTYYFRPELPDKTYARADYGLPDDVRLYVCPQALFKFHPQFDTVLGDLLRRDGEGRLILIDDKMGGKWKTLLMERFGRSFPDVVEHIIFAPHMPREKFHGLLVLADAVLDIPTFSGGNSSLEAFALGAPIVTWPQDFMRGRVTAAFYKQMGLSDLIATDADTYLDLALRLARDADFKHQMQAGIKANIDKLFERLDTVREMERFFIAAHDDWMTGRK